MLAALIMTATTLFAQSKVYFTKEITPEALVKIYEALGVEPQGRVAVKISTGEGGNQHYLKPTLIRNLVDKVFNYKGKPGDDNQPLIKRINRQHGTYITDYAEQIGLGSKTYTLINLDK